MDSSPRSCCDSLLVACDDSATLEAALSLIDDCSTDRLTEPIMPDGSGDLDATLDGVSEFLDSVDIPQISLGLSDANEPVGPVRAAAVPTQKKRGRTTPKQEIAQLRAQERELACMLESLRLQAYDRKQRGGSGKNTNVLPFWKKIASRQCQSRLDSERENRRLRSLVAMHVGRAKRLKIAWKKQMATEGYQEKPSPSDQLVGGVLPPDTPALLQILEEESDDVYADLEAFISGTRPPVIGHIPFIKHSDTYTLPFNQLTVGTAMWHALGARFRGNEQHIHATDSTITCCVQRAFRIANANFSLQIRWAGRKYCEDGRTIIITQTCLQPRHYSIATKVGFRETQVSIVTNTRPSSEQPEQLSVLSTVSTYTTVTGHGPEGETEDGMRSWIASREGVAVRDVWMHVLQVVRKNAIENQLFEETMAR